MQNYWIKNKNKIDSVLLNVDPSLHNDSNYASTISIIVSFCDGLKMGVQLLNTIGGKGHVFASLLTPQFKLCPYQYLAAEKIGFSVFFKLGYIDLNHTIIWKARYENIDLGQFNSKYPWPS